MTGIYNKNPHTIVRRNLRINIMSRFGHCTFKNTQVITVVAKMAYATCNCMYIILSDILRNIIG